MGRLKGSKPEPATPDTRPDEAVGRRGAFNPDGSWYAAAIRWNDETRFVNKLVHIRRTTAMTPGQFAARIAVHPFAGMFSAESMRVWANLQQPHEWSCVPTGNAAEETVKVCGFGQHYRWHPDGWCECTSPELFGHPLPSKPLDWPQPTMTGREALDRLFGSIGDMP